MELERTFSIIKPDATKRNLVGAICKKFEDSGLRIIAQKRIHFTRDQAEEFYGIHRERPFFDELCTFMTSEPVVVQVLEGDNAVEKYRKIMGATNPENAEKDTIRKEHALNIQENSVHGSDSNENAKIEINYFFDESEIINN